MSPGLQAAVLFAGSLPGHILMSLGQALVVVCLCFDFVRAVSVPRSRRRYVANTWFRTLALPSILVMAFSVLIDAASGSWPDVAAGVFVLVAVIFRWHHGSRRRQLVEGQRQGPGPLAPEPGGLRVPGCSGHGLKKPLLSGRPRVSNP